MFGSGTDGAVIIDKAQFAEAVHEEVDPPLCIEQHDRVKNECNMLISDKLSNLAQRSCCSTGIMIMEKSTRYPLPHGF